MIKATIQECRDAYVAFAGQGGIGSAALPHKAAWRVSRVIGKLKTVVRDFEETHRKLLMDAGGVANGNVVEIAAPERKEGESQADFEGRQKKHIETIHDLNKAVTELTKEEVEVSYDPIPLDLFGDERNPEKSAQLRPVDLESAGPFIKE